MQPSELEVGQLYVCQAYGAAYSSPRYKREYAGKPAIYMGLQPPTSTPAQQGFPLWLARYEAYKLLLNGELRYLPETFLKHLKKVLDNPVKAC